MSAQDDLALLKIRLQYDPPYNHAVVRVESRLAHLEEGLRERDWWRERYLEDVSPDVGQVARLDYEADEFARSLTDGEVRSDIGTLGRTAHLVACLERIPCQQMRTVEDCDVAVATHVLHPDRYEKVPRSEWCDRCDALSAARSLLADQGGAV